MVNMRGRNIFSGLYRVQVNGEIPALSFIYWGGRQQKSYFIFSGLAPLVYSLAVGVARRVLRRINGLLSLITRV